mmetsp:Transcript_61001/g.126291  ORF Transcript_61001/g.126291 Transcript_61001/m.126291 type:complete len:273 (-) Transcript_61001:2-820(-)
MCASGNRPGTSSRTSAACRHLSPMPKLAVRFLLLCCASLSRVWQIPPGPWRAGSSKAVNPAASSDPLQNTVPMLANIVAEHVQILRVTTVLFTVRSAEVCQSCSFGSQVFDAFSRDSAFLLGFFLIEVGFEPILHLHACVLHHQIIAGSENLVQPANSCRTMLVCIFGHQPRVRQLRNKSISEQVLEALGATFVKKDFGMGPSFFTDVLQCDIQTNDFAERIAHQHLPEVRKEQRAATSPRTDINDRTWLQVVDHCRVHLPIERTLSSDRCF